MSILSCFYMSNLPEHNTQQELRESHGFTELHPQVCAHMLGAPAKSPLKRAFCSVEEFQYFPSAFYQRQRRSQ